MTNGDKVVNNQQWWRSGSVLAVDWNDFEKFCTEFRIRCKKSKCSKIKYEIKIRNAIHFKDNCGLVRNWELSQGQATRQLQLLSIFVWKEKNLFTKNKLLWDFWWREKKGKVRNELAFEQSSYREKADVDVPSYKVFGVHLLMGTCQWDVDFLPSNQVVSRG